MWAPSPTRGSMVELTAVCASNLGHSWRRRSCALLLSLLADGCGDGVRASHSAPVPPHPDILRADAQGNIVDGRGERVSLWGATLDNQRGAWDELGPETDHDEKAFERLRGLGMNVAVLDMADFWFDDANPPFYSREEGFAYVDRNLEWARDHQMRLILRLVHYPDVDWGGECPVNAVFSDGSVQKQVVSLWRTLAERHQGDPTVAAYSVLDAVAPDESIEQWNELSQRLVETIRQADADHLIFLQQAGAVHCESDFPTADMFPALPDSANVGYDWFFGWQYDFTEQSLEDAGEDPLVYPDDATPLVKDWDAMEWLALSSDSVPSAELLRLAEGDTDWKQVRYAYRVTDPDFEIGELILKSDFNPGTVWFDDISVDEYDENGELVRTVFDVDFEDRDPESEFFLWQGDADGNELPEGPGGLEADEGHGEGSDVSVRVSNTIGLASATNNNYLFWPILNHIYVVEGWMKGEGIGKKAFAMFPLQFWSGNADVFNRVGLRRNLKDAVDFASSRRVPLLTEFAMSAAAQQRGGLQWIEDVLDVLSEHDATRDYQAYHFSYVAYQEEDGGLYLTPEGQLPKSRDSNQDLINLFTEKLSTEAEAVP